MNVVQITSDAQLFTLNSIKGSSNVSNKGRPTKTCQLLIPCIWPPFLVICTGFHTQKCSYLESGFSNFTHAGHLRILFFSVTKSHARVFGHRAGVYVLTVLGGPVQAPCSTLHSCREESFPTKTKILLNCRNLRHPAYGWPELILTQKSCAHPTSTMTRCLRIKWWQAAGST